jgi:glycosyltransferase involved in cell wall biosynthesis
MYRIILFNDSLVGGAGRVILNLADILCKHKFEIDIVIYENKVDYTIPKTINLYKLNIEKSKIKNKKAIVDALKNEILIFNKADLIISNSTPSNKILSLLENENIYHCVHSAEIKKYPNTIFGFLKSQWRKHRYKKLYNGKNLIFVSKELQALVEKDIGAKPKSMQVIYNPFDFDKIKNLANEKEIEICKESYIIHVGRLDMSSKRHDILLEAYKKSKISHKLIILGTGKDEEKIYQHIKRLNLENKVILIGFQENPYRWIKNSKLLLLTSDFEGLPTVLIEALILKTPVVSTNCPTGPVEILEGALSDFLVPIQNVEQIANKINEAISNYPLISDTIIDKFNQKKAVEQYKKLIEGNRC